MNMNLLNLSNRGVLQATLNTCWTSSEGPGSMGADRDYEICAALKPRIIVDLENGSALVADGATSHTQLRTNQN